MIKSEFLVIGSGLAGLNFAMHASKYGHVNIITKKDGLETSTSYAQGGIAAVWNEPDSIESHFNDTLNAGVGLCKQDIVKMVVHEGPALVQQLIDWGVEFTTKTNQDGTEVIDLTKEGGHTYPRVLHSKDATGSAIEKALIYQCKNNPNITVYEDHHAINLITSKDLVNPAANGRVYGAYVLNRKKGDVLVFAAKITVLATGGCGMVYEHTTNPYVSTGDGVAMAYRAGASIANMEFIQFHPTSLFTLKTDRSILISEAVRGEGAILRNLAGERFMTKYDTRTELAPRDIVARAIDSEMKKRGEDYVLLDLTTIGKPEKIKKRFPHIYQSCLENGYDITKEPAPVVPSAHYQCGGVDTDEWARTTLQSLYACGEVAHTGLHGANRLASNSLLEALVFSQRAATQSSQELKTHTSIPNVKHWTTEGVTDEDDKIVLKHNFIEIRKLMWDYVGIVRTVKGLRSALQRIIIERQEIRTYYWRNTISASIVETRNLALVAELIIRSAMTRNESRGLHYILEYPSRDDINYLKDTTLTKTNDK